MPREWHRLLIEFGIKEVVYFDKMKVSKVPDRNGKYVEYKQWWIGVGCSSKFKKQLQSNPSTQFKHYTSPPRIAKTSAVREVKYLLDSYHNDSQDRDDDHTTSSSFYSSQNTTRERLIGKINEEEEMEQNKSIQNLTFILQQLEDGMTTKEKSIELIIASIQESRLQAQQH